MKHIFYFITIFPLLWEFINITNINRTHLFFKTFRKMKGKKFDDYSPTQKKISILMMFYIIWVIIGLFSSQWIVFVSILIISIIPKKYIIIRWIDSLVSALLLLFIILNVYHFKIDLFVYLKSFIN